MAYATVPIYTSVCPHVYVRVYVCICVHLCVTCTSTCAYTNNVCACVCVVSEISPDNFSHNFPLYVAVYVTCVYAGARVCPCVPIITYVNDT